MEKNRANEVAKILKEQVLQNDPFTKVSITQGDDCSVNLMCNHRILSGWMLSRAIMYAGALGLSCYVSTDIDNAPVLYIY